MSRQEDEALAHAIAGGDEAAERAFDQMFRSKVEVFVRKRGIPRQDCADVALMVLHNALRQLRRGAYRAEASLATWLHPIISGGVADHFRKRGGPKLVSFENLPTSDDHCLVATESNDIVLAVRQALSRLTADDHPTAALLPTGPDTRGNRPAGQPAQVCRG
jgi:DNA-directed RNA polymerase specialized sigma24 family protein